MPENSPPAISLFIVDLMPCRRESALLRRRPISGKRLEHNRQCGNSESNKQEGNDGRAGRSFTINMAAIFRLSMGEGEGDINHEWCMIYTPTCTNVKTVGGGGALNVNASANNNIRGIHALSRHSTHWVSPVWNLWTPIFP